MNGVIGKFLRHKTGSLDLLNLFKIHILYVMMKNKHLDFARLIFDHLVASILGKKRDLFMPLMLTVFLLFLITLDLDILVLLMI